MRYTPLTLCLVAEHACTPTRLPTLTQDPPPTHKHHRSGRVAPLNPPCAKQLLRRGAAAPDLRSCLVLEQRVGSRLLRHPDLAQGLSAALAGPAGSGGPSSEPLTWAPLPDGDEFQALFEPLEAHEGTELDLDSAPAGAPKG